MNINLTIIANDPTELQHALQALAGIYAQTAPALAEPVAAVRPKKGAKTVTVELPVTAAPVDIGEEAAAPVEATPEEAAKSDTLVKELSPKDMRDAGTKLLMELYNRDQNTMPELSRLQAKFSVKKFSDIKDDDAKAFYTEALLVTNGTGEVHA